MTTWRERARTGWQLSRIVFERTDEAAVRTYAASIAYHAVVATTSLLTVLLFLANSLGMQQLRERVEELPPDLRRLAEEQAQRIDGLNDSTITVLSLLGLVIASWGLASGFAALYDALNRIYGTHRYRTYPQRLGRALLVAIFFSLAMLVAFSAAAAGSAVGRGTFDVIGLELVGTLVAILLRLTAMLVLAPIVFLLLLRYGSSARPPWSECITAGVVTGAGWILLTIGLLAVAELVAAFRGYGAITIMLLAMLYVYWTSFLLFTSSLFATAIADEVRRRRAAAQAAAAQSRTPGSG